MDCEVTPVRCNFCMNIMEETADHPVYQCSRCDRDDCLMVNFMEEMK